MHIQSFNIIFQNVLYFWMVVNSIQHRSNSLQGKFTIDYIEFDTTWIKFNTISSPYREILAWFGSTTWLCSWTNHVSVLCMGPIINTQSYTQYTHMIG